TRPSARSRNSASRTGPRLVCSWLAIWLSTSRSPPTSFPPAIRPRIASAACMARVWSRSGCSVSGAIAGRERRRRDGWRELKALSSGAPACSFGPPPTHRHALARPCAPLIRGKPHRQPGDVLPPDSTADQRFLRIPFPDLIERTAHKGGVLIQLRGIDGAGADCRHNHAVPFDLTCQGRSHRDKPALGRAIGRRALGADTAPL